MRVLVFGSSIEYGAWDTRGGWVDRLKQHFHQQFVDSNGEKKVQLINLGIGGDTSTKILKRMKNEIEARKSASWPFVFVFVMGTNDQRTTSGVPETSLEDLAHNIEEIIKIAKNYTNKILFVGKAPLGQEIVMFKNQEYSDERMRIYEGKQREIVEQAGITFLPVREGFEVKEGETLFTFDNLHPNDKGHALIYSIVKPELEKLLAA